MYNMFVKYFLRKESIEDSMRLIIVLSNINYFERYFNFRIYIFI